MTADKSIYHKNLMPVVYVTGDVAGQEESPLYAIMKMNRILDQLELPEGYRLERFVSHQPFSTLKYAMKWMVNGISLMRFFGISAWPLLPCWF